jgi:hypothetical protein
MTALAQSASAAGNAETAALRDKIEHLMAQARADDQMDRRGAARYPFFRPATLHSDQVELGPHQAFTRELSTSGIGLLHNVPLEPGAHSVAIHFEQGESYSFPTEILWSRPCGGGWFLSGGKFLFPA